MYILYYIYYIWIATVHILYTHSFVSIIGRLTNHHDSTFKPYFAYRKATRRSAGRSRRPSTIHHTHRHLLDSPFVGRSNLSSHTGIRHWQTRSSTEWSTQTPFIRIIVCIGDDHNIRSTDASSLHRMARRSADGTFSKTATKQIQSAPKGI